MQALMVVVFRGDGGNQPHTMTVLVAHFTPMYIKVLADTAKFEAFVFVGHAQISNIIIANAAAFVLITMLCHIRLTIGFRGLHLAGFIFHI